MQYSKTKIIESLDLGGIPASTITKVVNAFLGKVKEQLDLDNKVVIKGFGTFSPYTIKQRTIKVPSLPIATYPAVKSVSFKPAKALKKVIND